MTRYQRNYRRRARRTLTAQADDLTTKVAVNGISALVTRGFANAFCRAPYPDYALCQAFNNVAEKQAEEFGTSLLSLGICAALLSL